MIVELVRSILLQDPAIAAIVGAGDDGRIYPVQLPDAPTYPAIVITKITGLGDSDTDGDTGLEDSRVQVDSYGEGYAAVVELKTLVRARLSGFQGGPASGDACAIQGVFVINDSDLPVPETERAGPRLRRRMLEFRIWNRAI